MRVLFIGLIAFSLFAISSCSKQPIEDVTQAALSDIIVGNWKVATVKYTQEIDVASFSYTSHQQSGFFTFTEDSTYHNVNFTYKVAVDGEAIDFGGQTSQNGYYVLPEKDLDQIEVADQQSSSIVRYETRLRTAASMTLIYEYIEFDAVTGFKLVDRYSFDLIKA